MQYMLDETQKNNSLVVTEEVKVIDDEWIHTTTEASREFTLISNLILKSDYYRER